MTFVDLQRSVSELSADEQDKLAAYLTVLRRSRDPEWTETLNRRASDKNPDHWVPLDGLEKKPPENE